MKLEVRACPCGQCKKFNAWPLFGGQDTTLDRETAEELVKRWNAHEWIPVSDANRWPELGENVLGFFPPDKYGRRKALTHRFGPKPTDWTRNGASGPPQLIPPPTYWMPLPEDPK